MESVALNLSFVGIWMAMYMEITIYRKKLINFEPSLFLFEQLSSVIEIYSNDVESFLQYFEFYAGFWPPN